MNIKSVIPVLFGLAAIVSLPFTGEILEHAQRVIPQPGGSPSEYTQPFEEAITRCRYGSANFAEEKRAHLPSGLTGQAARQGEMKHSGKRSDRIRQPEELAF